MFVRREKLLGHNSPADADSRHPVLVAGRSRRWRGEEIRLDRRFEEMGTTPAGREAVSVTASEPWRGTVSFHALGCKANQEEMECLVSRLAASGFAVVPFGEPADWVFVNTCTVTWAADSDSRQFVRRAVRSKVPGGRVVVTGCMVQRDPLAAARIEGVDWVVGNGEKPHLAHWIESASDLPEDAAVVGSDSCTRILVGADPTIAGFAEYGVATDGRRTRASLKVQDGCDEHCTFCVIPRVRGASRSRPLSDCLSQARTLVASEYREIALTGINTALWGRDLEPEAELGALLGGLLRVEGLARIRLNSLEPQYVTDEWLRLLASDDRFCRHLHMPLQSGNDRILRRMNRRYDLAHYEGRVRAAASWMPDVAIGADVMVGFPGETPEEFARTLAYLESLPLAYLHVFSYSPRPDTASPRMGPAVDVGETKARSHALRGLSERLRVAQAERAVGTWQTVIPEGAWDGGWQGLSGNYLRVRFPWEGAEPPGPEPRRVRIEAAHPDGTVSGRLDGAKFTRRPGAGARVGALPDVETRT